MTRIDRTKDYKRQIVLFIAHIYINFYSTCFIAIFLPLLRSII